MATLVSIGNARQADRQFFGAMALILTVATVWGFGPSFYFSGMVTGPETWFSPGSPARWLFLVHGLAFTAWIALYLVQTLLIANRQPGLHRSLGQVAVVLAPLMVVVGLIAGVYGGRHGFHNVGVPAPSFLAVPFFSVVLFGTFVWQGLARRRDPAAHKRLMLLAAIVIADAAIARLGFVHAVFPPWFDAAVLVLALLPLWDAVSLRRLHPVTVWGGAALAIFMLGAVPLGMTPVWLALVHPILN